MHKLLKFQIPSSSLPSFSSSQISSTQWGSMPSWDPGNLTISSNNIFGSPTGLQDYINQKDLSNWTPAKSSSYYSDYKNLDGMLSQLRTPGKALNLNNAGSIISSITNPIVNAVHNNSRYGDDPTADLQNNIRTGITDAALKSGNPIAMAIGAAAKLGDTIMDATGTRADNISKDTQEKVGMSGVQRFINNSMNFIPGNPLAMGSKKLSEGEKFQETEAIRGSYADTLDDIDTAEQIGGGRVNFLLGKRGRNKSESFINLQNKNNSVLADISKINTMRKQSDYEADLSKQNYNKYVGKDYQAATVGKEGMKLPEFKDGGVIGVDSSVIPEGALHKELNHMEEFNEELDKVITDKGIAVVVTDEEGQIEQVAEIEKEEIVFRLSLTKQIEELWHNGSEEAMIKAGKLIAKEITKNTDDNTGDFLDGDNQN